MRKIIFRAWDKENKFMFKIFDSTAHQDWFLPSWNLNGRYEVMQYVGLEDKNGKEIYEGDIILLKHEIGYNMLDESKEVVIFHNGAFSCNIYTAPGDNVCECEVIGNIYENKSRDD